jgi:hypothetical protein
MPSLLLTLVLGMIFFFLYWKEVHFVIFFLRCAMLSHLVLLFQAQDMLADAVHMAFKQLVIALQSELELVLPSLLSDR